MIIPTECEQPSVDRMQCVCLLFAVYQHAKRQHLVDLVTDPAVYDAAGDGSSRGQAGAVAAAARELRPVEIVGLYEEQKDRAEVLLRLFACTCYHGSEQSKHRAKYMLCSSLLAFEESVEHLTQKVSEQQSFERPSYCSALHVC